MYKNIEDFILDWEEEALSTIKIFEKINDAGISTRLNDDIRTLGRTAWHITQTLTELPANAKLISEDPLENKEEPESMEAILKVYKQKSMELINILRENWKDSDLDETIEIYKQTWKKNKVLSVIIKHQIHHRGQMTVIMRLLNMKVPGVYGPSKEEWAEHGMEAEK